MKRNRVLILRRTGLIAASLFTLFFCGQEVSLVFKPSAWNFVTNQSSGPLEQKVAIENQHTDKIELTFTPTSPRLTVSPHTLELGGDETDHITIRYDPSSIQGRVAMQTVVRARKGNSISLQYFPVTGKVLVNTSGKDDSIQSNTQLETPQEKTTPPLFFEYFYDSGCKGCEIFIVREMITLQKKLGIRLHVSMRDIREPEIYDTYTHVLDALGVKERAYPAIVFQGTVLQGEQEIEQELEDVLRKYYTR